ncbi:MAG TPA: hypothetical protein PKD64_09605 [Pirellulaceae bacterium]|nr:hypothetical protein [Pirellulaceae bacterium]HMO92441.1 hypothetical protein [Pirellulaceae bacterium]HMP67889.1 hypothetical protein [Pirellulaceae bacterium]
MDVYLWTPQVQTGATLFVGPFFQPSARWLIAEKFIQLSLLRVDTSTNHVFGNAGAYMPKLLHGKVFPSGAIEFSYAMNPWAKDWALSMVKQNKSIRQLYIRPDHVEIKLEASPGLDANEFDWIERTNQILMISDKVFLKSIEQSFRFSQAELDLGKERTLMTVSATDLQKYAQQHWNRVKYFYAYRYEEFYFDLKKLVTGRQDKPASHVIELVTRLRRVEEENGCHISFAATGSTVCNEFITWRRTVEKGATGRFAQDDMEVKIELGGAKRPITFLRESRPEFKNVAYEFESEYMEAQLAKRLPQPAPSKKSGKDSKKPKQSK